MSLQQIPAIIKPHISSAPLPVNYEAAKRAIAECYYLDECKGWSDRAAAIASYARQIRDNTLLDKARRIRLRAKARLGELLLEIPKSKSKTGKGQLGGVGDPMSRQQIGKRLGLASSTASNAMSIARVPAPARERLIENNPPVREADLVTMGRMRTYTLGASYAIAIGKDRGLAQFRTFCRLNPAERLAEGMSADEAKLVRKYLVPIQEWLDKFEQYLPRGSAK